MSINFYLKYNFACFFKIMKYWAKLRQKTTKRRVPPSYITLPPLSPLSLSLSLIVSHLTLSLSLSLSFRVPLSSLICNHSHSVSHRSVSNFNLTTLSSVSVVKVKTHTTWLDFHACVLSLCVHFWCLFSNENTTV